MNRHAAPTLRVAICGGGVGGLTLAIVLAKNPNIQVDVYEAARELKEVGAGIGMWPRAWKIMKKLGLDHDLGQKSIIPAEGIPKVAFQFRKGDEPQGQTFQTLVTPGGLISFHRPDFQSVLLDHLKHDPSFRTHTSKRLVSYTQEPVGAASSSGAAQAVTLLFADGTTATCDLLVGADGIKSAVRASMLEQVARGLSAQGQKQAAEQVSQAVEAKWSGTMAYRAVIPAEQLRSRHFGHRVLDTPHVYLGKDTMMTVYPMARGTLVNFAAFRAHYDVENTVLDGPVVQTVSRQEFARDFNDWEPEVKALIECVPTASRWAVHTVLPLPTFVSGQTVLLGDAAHAMMPYQGSGAGQAIEDAYILGTLLSHPLASLNTLPLITEIYDTIRRPFAQQVASVSRDAGLLYTLNYPGLSFEKGAARDRSRDAERLQEVFNRIRMNWEWAWDTSVDGDVLRAVQMLEEKAR